MLRGKFFLMTIMTSWFVILTPVEITFKIWSFKSKGSAKLFDKKGGWYDINNNQLIFTYPKFDRTSEARIEELKTTWNCHKNDDKKLKSISYLMNSV